MPAARSLASHALSELRPGPAPLVAALCSFVVLGLGLVLALIMGLDPTFKGGMAAGLGAGSAFFAFGPAALLTAGGALFEPRPLAKAALLGLAAAHAAGVGLGLMLGMAVSEGDVGAAVLGGLCCGGLPAVGVLGWAGLSGSAGWGALRTGSSSSQRAALLQALKDEGFVPLNQLAAAIAVDLPALRARLAELRPPDGPARVDAAGGWACLPATWEEAEGRLPGLIATRGVVRMDELRVELRAPPDAVQRLIEGAAAAGRLHGVAIDGQKGVLYARGAAGAGAGCGACGGQLLPAGQGLLRCQSCGAQVFA